MGGGGTVKDLALHFVGGAALAALELWVTGSAVLAIFWPLLLGHTRETEQHRRRNVWRAHHPSYFWYWSRHMILEWLAWPAGAIAAVVLS